MVFIPGPRFARAGRTNGGGGRTLTRVSYTSPSTPSHPLWTAHYLMPSSPIGPASSSKPRPGYKYHVLPSLFTLHTLHPALEDGTDRGFRNVGKLQSDAGEIPKRIHTISNIHVTCKFPLSVNTFWNFSCFHFIYYGIVTHMWELREDNMRTIVGGEPKAGKHLILGWERRVILKYYERQENNKSNIKQKFGACIYILETRWSVALTVQ